MADNNSNIVWKNWATRQESDLLQRLGDRMWDSYRIPTHELDLKQRIGLALFASLQQLQGNPTLGNRICDQPVLDAGLLNTFYTADQRKKIDEIYELIVKKSNEPTLVDVAFLFVFAESGCQRFPLFKVDGGEGDNCTYIDWNGRVYKGWEDFKKHNMITGGKICAPRKGTYKPGADGLIP